MTPEELLALEAEAEAEAEIQMMEMETAAAQENQPQTVTATTTGGGDTEIDPLAAIVRGLGSIWEGGKDLASYPFRKAAEIGGEKGAQFEADNADLPDWARMTKKAIAAPAAGIETLMELPSRAIDDYAEARTVPEMMGDAVSMAIPGARTVPALVRNVASEMGIRGATDLANNLFALRKPISFEQGVNNMISSGTGAAVVQGAPMAVSKAYPARFDATDPSTQTALRGAENFGRKPDNFGMLRRPAQEVIDSGQMRPQEANAVRQMNDRALTDDGVLQSLGVPTNYTDKVTSLVRDFHTRIDPTDIDAPTKARYFVDTGIAYGGNFDPKTFKFDRTAPPMSGEEMARMADDALVSAKQERGTFVNLLEKKRAKLEATDPAAFGLVTTKDLKPTLAALNEQANRILAPELGEKATSIRKSIANIKDALDSGKKQKTIDTKVVRSGGELKEVPIKEGKGLTISETAAVVEQLNQVRRDLGEFDLSSQAADVAGNVSQAGIKEGMMGSLKEISKGLRGVLDAKANAIFAKDPIPGYTPTYLRDSADFIGTFEPMSNIVLPTYVTRIETAAGSQRGSNNLVPQDNLIGGSLRNAARNSFWNSMKGLWDDLRGNPTPAQQVEQFSRDVKQVLPAELQAIDTLSQRPAPIQKLDPYEAFTSLKRAQQTANALFVSARQNLPAAERSSDSLNPQMIQGYFSQVAPDEAARVQPLLLAANMATDKRKKDELLAEAMRLSPTLSKMFPQGKTIALSEVGGVIYNLDEQSDLKQRVSRGVKAGEVPPSEAYKFNSDLNSRRPLRVVPKVVSP